MHLVRRKPPSWLGHVFAGDLLRVLECRAFGQFRHHRTRRDGCAASEGLEANVLDPVVLDGDRDLHHVPARGIADLAHAVRILYFPMFRDC